MRRFLHTLMCLMLIAFAGCDVHEFPSEHYDKVAFQLHLDFDTEMPLHKEVAYTRNGELETKGVVEHHDIRYTIKAYRTDNVEGENRVEDATFVFTKHDATDLNYTANLYLSEGTYDFRVWADYVDVDSTDDKYYNTEDFAAIILADKDNHSGSNDYRDAFRGYATATVMNPAYYTGPILDTINNEATAEMKRPMGKFKFVSTDVEVFLSRVAQMMKERGMLMNVELDSDPRAAYEQLLQSIDLGDFYVVFRYNYFMPREFNMFTDKPGDSWTGMSFVSRMYAEDEKEMTLGYDYVFVNGTETTLAISVEVYNREGELMSSSNPVNVPIVRSKLTVVKGEFLTSKATGGVTINPGYDGDDYNIEIY
ncbi:MAG: hypothetical protein IJX40_06335 [Alistipes sp.]|nr:hypothetical protein [Alistipes sp.]